MQWINFEIDFIKRFSLALYVNMVWLLLSATTLFELNRYFLWGKNAATHSSVVSDNWLAKLQLKTAYWQMTKKKL